PQFRAKHATNVELAKKGDIDLLFMGDSITDFWRRPAAGNITAGGKAVFDKYFGAMKVANFGISGDTTQGVLFRLQDGEGQGFSPKAIMLMIGTNNTNPANNCSSAEIAEGVGAIVMEMRKDFPSAKILLLGIFPRANPGDAIRKTVLDVNPIIAKLHDGKNVFYLDIGARFLDAEGRLPSDVMADRLHPDEKGYEIWAEAVKGPLAELMK
ncbi:MAG: GDSL-type esterase/lipase family protein, partial [Opitutaceae bacterium]